MKPRAISLIALIVALGSFGCKQGISEKDLIGDWEGKVSMSADEQKQALEDAKKSNPNASGITADAMNSMLESMRYPLTLNEDKTFKMTMVMFPMEGTWSLNEGKVTLTMTKMMGMDLNSIPGQNGKKPDNPPMILTVSEDGKTMTGRPPESGSSSSSSGGTITFTRKESK